jgi:hypothetical protein
MNSVEWPGYAASMTAWTLRNLPSIRSEPSSFVKP